MPKYLNSGYSYLHFPGQMGKKINPNYVLIASLCAFSSFAGIALYFNRKDIMVLFGFMAMCEYFS